MLCDIIVDKGDGVRDRVFSDIDLSLWNVRQWYGLYSVFHHYVQEYGFSRITIVPNKSF